jgi:sigma-54 specific flagellar transcriptional regulator A
MQVRIEKDGNSMQLDVNSEKPIRLQDMLCALEKAILVKVLHMKCGVKARAAEALSLNRTTLVEKLKKYGT